MAAQNRLRDITVPYRLGVPLQEELIWEGDFTREGAYQVVRTRLQTAASWERRPFLPATCGHRRSALREAG